MIRSHAARVGLGLLVGAVLHGSAGAQGVQTTIPVPTAADSAAERVPNAPSDTLLPPTTRAEQPRIIRADSALHWTRAQLDAMDAITLGTLLEHVPDVTPIGSGWIAAPAMASCFGRVPCIRVFEDGVEIDELDPRSGGVSDLSQFQLWAADEVSIERVGDEVRVSIRTRTCTRLTPFTETDIATGDENTNLYRGLFCRGFHNGMSVQVGGQEYGTTPAAYLGTSSDELSLLARIGWAGRGMSVDGMFLHGSRHRGVIDSFEPTGDSIPTLDASRTLAYLRAGAGDPDASPLWAQAVASVTSYSYTGVAAPPSATGATTPVDSTSLDTSRTRRQFVVTGGFNGLDTRLSVAERLRMGDGPTVSTPSARASFTPGPLQLAAFAEGRGPDSTTHLGATGEVDVLSRLRISGSFGITNGPLGGRVDSTLDIFGDTTITVSGDTTHRRISSKSSRIELGVRFGGMWISGGMLHRDSVGTSAPILYQSTFAPSVDGPATGVVAEMQGRLYGPFNLDVAAVRWDTVGIFRPQYQTRAALTLKTELLNHFPKGTFGFAGSIIHEYRSGTFFPVNDGTLAEAPGYRTFSSLVEVRIMTAVLTWRFSNFLGEKYFQVPGYLMPRLSNYYGIRWVFWN